MCVKNTRETPARCAGRRDAEPPDGIISTQLGDLYVAAAANLFNPEAQWPVLRMHHVDDVLAIRLNNAAFGYALNRKPRDLFPREGLFARACPKPFGQPDHRRPKQGERPR